MKPKTKEKKKEKREVETRELEGVGYNKGEIHIFNFCGASYFSMEETSDLRI